MSISTLGNETCEKHHYSFTLHCIIQSSTNQPTWNASSTSSCPLAQTMPLPWAPEEATLRF